MAGTNSTQCAVVKRASAEMRAAGYDDSRRKAVTTYLGIVVDRMADRGSSLCRWDPSYTKTQSTFGRPALPFVWDYAHKTTLGWATLVEALRKSGFTVVEAWPLDTEFGGRLIAIDSAALASSIFRCEGSG
jgi:adenine-specific DNA methylase